MIARLVVGICLILIIQSSFACRQQWRLRARAFLQEIFNVEPQRMADIDDTGQSRQNRPINLVNTLFGLNRPTNDDFSFFKPFELYTDEGGCYEEGNSQQYMGKIDYTETGLPCSKWTVFSYWLNQRLIAAQERKNQRVMESIWNLSPHDSARDDAEIMVANQTIRDMHRKDLLDHNYCRDPDKSGKPWCFIETKNFVLWQACGVPKCTACWRLRQRTIRFIHVPPLLETTWIPTCKIDGSFDNLQCWKTYCWCADDNGQLIKGTLTNKTDGTPLCTKEYTKPGAKRMRVTRRRRRKVTSKNRKTVGKVLYRNLAIKTAKTKAKPTPQQSKPQSAMTMNDWIQRMFHGTLRTRVQQTKKSQQSNHDYGAADEKHDNVTITSRDGKRKYKCEIRYTTVNTLRCDPVPRTTRQSNKLSTTTGPLRRCYVVQKLRVIGWACTRDIDDASWYVVRFSRVPITSRRIGKYSKAIFQGISYICTGPTTTNKRRDAKRCNVTCPCRTSTPTFTTIYLKEVGKVRYMCFKSWRRWRLVKSTCVKLDAKADEA